MTMHIRILAPADYDAVWEIFRQVVEAGDTFPHAPCTTKEEAIRYWAELPHASYVAERNGAVIGAYYLRPNQIGLGAHVCNAGYIVRRDVRGSGVGKALCIHSIGEARRLGYRAMQFNLVVATNKAGIALYQQLGFQIVGTLPGAFRHLKQGFVDAYVMYRDILT